MPSPCWPTEKSLSRPPATFSASGASGQDEDLFAFTPTALGSTTAGSWAIYFDGSDVGLSTNDNEDVNALYVREGGGNPTLFLSTLGNFSVTGASGANEDAFAFTPTTLGSTTAGTSRSRPSLRRQPLRPRFLQRRRHPSGSAREPARCVCRKHGPRSDCCGTNARPDDQSTCPGSSGRGASECHQSFSDVEFDFAHVGPVNIKSNDERDDGNDRRYRQQSVNCRSGHEFDRQRSPDGLGPHRPFARRYLSWNLSALVAARIWSAKPGSCVFRPPWKPPPFLAK